MLKYMHGDQNTFGLRSEHYFSYEKYYYTIYMSIYVLSMYKYVKEWPCLRVIRMFNIWLTNEVADFLECEHTDIWLAWWRDDETWNLWWSIPTNQSIQTTLYTKESYHSKKISNIIDLQLVIMEGFLDCVNLRKIMNDNPLHSCSINT